MTACAFPRRITLPDGQRQVVRCGKCLACLAYRQASWITRLSQMSKDYPDSTYFVTYTYSDEHVPLKDGVTVVDPVHICKLHKDLRKRFQQGFYEDHTLEQLSLPSQRIKLPYCKFKYYLTSEYGPQTRRPHYHAMYFGLPPDEDLTLDLLTEVWGKGFVTCEKAKSDAAPAYVAKYLVNNSLIPLEPGQTRPFARMSKGLGLSYMDNQAMIDWHRSAPSDRAFVQMDGKRGILPRYLRDRIFDDDMKADLLASSLKREERQERAFLRLSPYLQIREGVERHNRYQEAVNQAEWRFRKNGKIK